MWVGLEGVARVWRGLKGVARGVKGAEQGVARGMGWT